MIPLLICDLMHSFSSFISALFAVNKFTFNFIVHYCFSSLSNLLFLSWNLSVRTPDIKFHSISIYRRNSYLSVKGKWRVYIINNSVCFLVSDLGSLQFPVFFLPLMPVQYYTHQFYLFMLLAFWLSYTLRLIKPQSRAPLLFFSFLWNQHYCSFHCLSQWLSFCSQNTADERAFHYFHINLGQLLHS